jgi:hypothetical protein
MDDSEDGELRKLIHADFSAVAGSPSTAVAAAATNGGGGGAKKKPKKATGKTADKPAPAQVFLCEKCEKTYKTKGGLIKHKLTCLK